MACDLAPAEPSCLCATISITVGAINSTLKAAKSAPAPNAFSAAVMDGRGVNKIPTIEPNKSEIALTAPIKNARKSIVELDLILHSLHVSRL